jgi:hypothetical protein
VCLKITITPGSGIDAVVDCGGTCAFSAIEKHATNGKVITIDPLGLITIVGLVPHVPPNLINCIYC